MIKHIYLSKNNVDRVNDAWWLVVSANMITGPRLSARTIASLPTLYIYIYIYIIVTSHLPAFCLQAQFQSSLEIKI